MTKKIKKVLITGVAGFIGRFVAKYFAEQGWITIGIDSIPYENAPVMYLSSYQQLHLPDEALHTILHEHSPEACINCAGRSSVPWSFPNPAIDFASNTVLPYYILDASACTRLQRSASIFAAPRYLEIRKSFLSARTPNRHPFHPTGFTNCKANSSIASSIIYTAYLQPACGYFRLMVRVCGARSSGISARRPFPQQASSYRGQAVRAGISSMHTTLPERL